MAMNLDPTVGLPGTAGPTRAATALANDLRRGVTPPEIEREAVARTTERAAYGSPGLRPAGDPTREVVVQLSQKALALARSASNPPPRTKSVDADDDPAARVRRRSDDDRSEPPPRPRIDARA
jgi:hypothetical protein